jgi:hypothetical protein
MASDLINSRADFFRVLDESIQIVEQRLRRAAHPWPYDNIERQLTAMKAWTANGRAPIDSERESIDVGLIALRELEPVDTVEDEELVTNLHELNYYFENWPSGANVGA